MMNDLTLFDMPQNNNYTPRITRLLQGRDSVIEFNSIRERFPWMFEENKKCILSPDSDGLLCGLFMSYYFHWEIIGFYDGKVMVLKNDKTAYDEDVVFLDMEICRRGIKSVGHHMLLLNRNNIPRVFYTGFRDCLQPNLLRDYDGQHDFRLKYPLATIHLLLAIIGHFQTIRIPETAITPLFFADGTFQVLYGYPENVLNWLDYLGIQNNESVLRQVFMHEHYTVYSQILAMDDFFRRRDSISIARERGDRLRISNPDGTPANLEHDGQFYKISDDAVERIKRFILLLSYTTGWDFDEHKWHFQSFQLKRFTKGDFQGRGWRINGESYSRLMELNPLSWAMTSGTNIEFTIETPDTM